MMYALLIMGLTFIGKLSFDLHLYYSHKVNKHTIGPAFVVIAIIAASWLTHWWYAPLWAFTWAGLFDPMYAILIGQKWNYLGTTAKLDRLQNKYPVLIWLKYFGAITSIIIFIWLK